MQSAPGGDKNKGPQGEKSKAQQRAERRAVQEAQRAAKGLSKTGDKPLATPVTAPNPVPQRQTSTTSGSSPKPSPKIIQSVPETTQVSQVTAQHNQQPKPAAIRSLQGEARQHDRQRSFNSETGSVSGDVGGAIDRLGIFSHLPVPEKRLSAHLTKTTLSSESIHPAIVKLGIQYSNGIISGSNARCVALIHAMKQVISDYVTPMDKVLCRDLESTIKPYINFLAQSRPLAVSMGNAIRQIKWLISRMPVGIPDSEAKSRLIEALDHYVEEKITLAGEAISNTYAAEKITDGDVILTYSCSSLVTKVLMDSFSRGKKFSVVVVDARPRNEGRELLRRLVRHGIKCSYVHINSISYVMPEISKILIGAECLLANGYVMSRVGSSQIALVAKAFNVPVLVCCETYKFCERVLTDSIVHNELGSQDDLRVPNEANPIEDPPSMSRLNLLFDVTPPDMITMVITELGMVPCTSVPVVLRVKHALPH